MNQLIKNISEIDFANKPTIEFLATISEVINQGDGDKKPFKVLVRLEESGEITQIFSWTWNLLDMIHDAEKNLKVYKIVGEASLYKDETQIKLLQIKDAGMISAKKKLSTVDSDAIKKELKEIIKLYVSSQSVYHKLIDELVFKNEKFWKWPAATKMHHAYEGGLAKHTLNVLKNTVSIWKTYEGQNINIEALVAGAVLHDIGKLREYNQDGTRTIYGDMVPHIISGFEEISLKAVELGINVFSDPSIIILQNIILSHHEKLEFGSPVQPGTLEAVIVAKADCLDANIETCEKTLDNTETSQETVPLLSMNNTKLLKWHN